MSSPAVLDSGFRAASLGYLKESQWEKKDKTSSREKPWLPCPSYTTTSVFHFFSSSLSQSVPAPHPILSAPIPWRAQYCLQKFLNLVGVCVHFGAIQQKWKLPSWAQLLYCLSPPGEETRHQDRKRGPGRTRKERWRDVGRERGSGWKEGIMRFSMERLR